MFLRSSSVIVDFDTQDGIEVLKLCPDINLMMNNGGLTNQSITFFLDYYYRSYSNEDVNVAFEQLSTIRETQYQDKSYEYGDQVTDDGAGGDNGYVATNQYTDAQFDLGSAPPIGIGPPININGNANGSGYSNRWQDTISGNQNRDSMDFVEGTKIASDEKIQYLAGPLSYFQQYSWQHSFDHYPGNPEQSWYDS